MKEEILDEELMTTEMVAEYTKIAKSTLQMYRTMGTGPKFIKIRRRLVRYRKYMVDEWLNEMYRNHTEQTFMQRMNRRADQMIKEFDNDLKRRY